MVYPRSIPSGLHCLLWRYENPSLHYTNTRMFEKGCHFLKRSWNVPPLPDMQQYQPSSVRCLRYCLVRRSTCRAAWLGRESAKESNMVLVYTCTIRTHERLKKGAVFLKRVGTSRLYPTCNSTKSVRQHVCISVAHMNYVKNGASFSNMKRVWAASINIMYSFSRMTYKFVVLNLIQQ